MAEDDVKPNGSVPPKLDLTKAAQPAPPPAQEQGAPLSQPPTVAVPKPAAKRQTTRIDFSAAAMVPDEKSKTARINLGPLGLDTAATPTGPKTIRIQRASEMPTIKLGKPQPPAQAPAEAAKPPEGKVKTSRIPLESAMAPAAAAPEATLEPAPATGPKTIRIKRPGEQEPPAAPVEAPQPKGKTARLDVPADSAAPPTQRKTIRIKRPEGEGADLKPLEVARAPEAVEAEVDEPGITFSLVALAAVFVCGVLIYVLAVQAMPGLGLQWPGQLGSP